MFGGLELVALSRCHISWASERSWELGHMRGGDRVCGIGEAWRWWWPLGSRGRCGGGGGEVGGGGGGGRFGGGGEGGRGGRLGTSSPSVVSWQWPARQVSASLASSNPFSARLTRPTPSTYLPSDVGHDSLVLSSQPTDPTESSIRRKSPDQSQVRSPIGISPPSDYRAIDNKTARLRRLIWLNSFKMTQKKKESKY